ncbi:DNA topoisomerase 2-alpha-like isoform X4 [Styela clava]
MLVARVFCSFRSNFLFSFSRSFCGGNSVNPKMDSEEEFQKMTFKPIIKTPDSKINKDNKRMSVERIYQKKTQLEHILLRPDTYIGSIETVTQPMWIWEEGVGMVNREITFVPGLYKIFDEILVNAADNKQRDPKMSSIKIDIDPEENRISVWNDGKGIPVVEHKTEKLFVPELIFGHLLTSSNYDDDEKKVTGGRNGYGAKLCNIFSTKFVVETSSQEYKKKFKQTWTGNMAKAGDKKLGPNSKSDYTCVTFYPDLKKFKMDKLDKDIVGLLSRRAYDIAGASKGVKVFLNGQRLPVKNFLDYVQLYTKNVTDENGDPYKIIHDQVNPRWEICITTSDKGFQQLSFVNSIATTKGGRHVDYVMDQVIKKLTEVVKKKNGKGGIDVKPFQIKNHCWVFVNCLIENPTFDSQTKENMTLQAKKFGSKCSLTDKFLKSASTSGIVDNIMNWVKFKAQTQLNKKFTAAKSSKLKGVPKLDDANDAGTRNSADCTLILTEGDSAKTLAVSGLSVVGRDKYGVFPLRGKMLNVRDASHKQIMDNAEINNVIKIMGLQYSKKYGDENDLKSLRYGKLMIMTDQDHDGSHIKGLLINFIHANWPKLLHRRVMEEFITPIVKVSKGSQVLSFYSIPEYEDWEKSTANSKSWKVKYYKGLGTSTAKEAKEYFADMNRHRIPFKYSGPDDDGNIDLAFNKKRADDRKEWLTNFMDSRRRRREDGRPDSDILYNANVKSLSYSDFVNKELILFSCADLERSVPSLVDGLKPGQRKVLYTCMKRNDKREVKVAQLAGSVAELSAYHHGEVSLMSTIINMAQNFVGSNNLNLLQPIGQFGTRLHGGKDAASPRYIFTMLSPLTRLLFPAIDDNTLTWCYDDNQRVEPEWYCPIIPMILVNGSQGIGTGWSTSIPNHDIRDIVENCRRMIDGDEPKPMKVSYKNFKGTIEEIEPNRYVCSGEIAVLDDDSVEITELPIKTWTQAYKESTLELMFLGTDKVPQKILEYKDYNTDTTVKFKVKMSSATLRQNEDTIHKFFNLQNTMTFANTLVMFDEFGCLKKYNTTLDILKDFYKIRLKKYHDRKEFLMGLLTAEAKKLSNQARFIVEKIDGVISIFNKPKKELIKLLLDRGYDSDPVKTWKASLAKKDVVLTEDANESDTEESDPSADFNYILGMPLWSLSREKKDDLLKQRDAKQKELDDLTRKTPSKLWQDDLDRFMEELEKVEKAEREEAEAEIVKSKNRGLFGAKGRGKALKGVKMETMPSPHGIRCIPRIDTALKTKISTQARKKKEDSTARKLESFFKTEDGTKVKVESDGHAKEAVVAGMDIDDDVDKPLSLAQRLSIKNSTKEKPKPVKPATKQTTLSFKPKSKPSGGAGGTKGKKKKNPWDSDSDVSEGFSSDEDSEEYVPKKSTKRTAKTKKDKSDDSDDDILAAKMKSSNNKLSDDDSEDDIALTKKKNKQNSNNKWSDDDSEDDIALTKKKNKRDFIDLDDIDEDSEPPAKKADLSWDEIKELEPPPPAKKTAVKRKKLNDFGASSSEDILKTKPPKKQAKKAEPKKPAASKSKSAPKKGKKKELWDSGSDFSGGNSGSDDDEKLRSSDSEFVPKRSTARRGAAAQKKYNFDDSDDSDF